MSLNQDATFSTDETRAAKSELDQRNRTDILNALDTTKNGGGACKPQAWRSCSIMPA